jgi:hypothetical protein
VSDARVARTGAKVGGPRLDAQLRRASARATKTIADRAGMRLGMWYGAGYPKSGTTWLCNLMSSYLDVPFVRNYRLPVLMPCVVHSHWLPSHRVPRTIYIVRDGRDVLVSRYFYEARAVRAPRNPRGGRLRLERFNRLYGPQVDLDDISANLPKFIADEMTAPQLTGANWPEHVRRWLAVPGERVAVVRYELLHADVCAGLGPAFEQLTGQPTDRDYLGLAAARFEFAAQARRNHLRADTTLMRAGAVGGWRDHFTDEARAIFDRHAGDLLRELDYPSD